MNILKALFAPASGTCQHLAPSNPIASQPLVIVDNIDSIHFENRTKDGLLNFSLVRTHLDGAAAMNIHTIGYIVMQVDGIDFLLRSTFWCMVGMDDNHMTGAEEIMSFDIKNNPQLRITPPAQLVIANEIIKRIQGQEYIDNPYRQQSNIPFSSNKNQTT